MRPPGLVHERIWPTPWWCVCVCMHVWMSVSNDDGMSGGVVVRLYIILQYFWLEIQFACKMWDCLISLSRVWMLETVIHKVCVLHSVSPPCMHELSERFEWMGEQLSTCHVPKYERSHQGGIWGGGRVRPKTWHPLLQRPPMIYTERNWKKLIARLCFRQECKDCFVDTSTCFFLASCGILVLFLFVSLIFMNKAWKFKKKNLLNCLIVDVMPLRIIATIGITNFIVTFLRYLDDNLQRYFGMRSSFNFYWTIKAPEFQMQFFKYCHVGVVPSTGSTNPRKTFWDESGTWFTLTGRHTSRAITREYL